MINTLRKIKRKITGIKETNSVPSTQLKLPNNIYADFDQSVWDLVDFVKPYTRTSPERVFSLIQAINYIEKNNIEGDVVECGVWRGGSMMAAAKCLINNDNLERTLYLYDTFEGMTESSEKDISFKGKKASEYLNNSNKLDPLSVWCFASLDDVKKNIKLTNYPDTKIKYVKGKVEETIPSILPEKIAILRLDTDWYESTKHELVHLFPKLVKGGILIIDDYGHWQGAKLATDEYLEENKIEIFLNRIDYTCRIGVKVTDDNGRK